jgi:hypothetical protein
VTDELRRLSRDDVLAMIEPGDELVCNEHFQGLALLLVEAKDGFGSCIIRHVPGAPAGVEIRRGAKSVGQVYRIGAMT